MGFRNNALYANANNDWTEKETKLLIDTLKSWQAEGNLMYQGSFGKLYRSVATELGRSVSAIHSKHDSLRRQGKVDI